MQRKTTWMLFLIFGFSAMCFSCQKRIEPIKNVNYIYKNETTFDLDMEVYDNGEKFKHFSILPYKEVETGTTREEGPAPFLFYEPTMKYGDSVVIRFSDNRCIVFSRNSGVDIYGDKIFDFREYDNYSEELVSGSNFSLIYTITEEDYNSSVACD
jgi:hypothetical protein